MFGVRDSIFLNDSLWREISNSAAEPVPAHVIVPGEAVPPSQAKVRDLRRRNKKKIMSFNMLLIDFMCLGCSSARGFF